MSASDWILYVMLPVLLIGAGAWLLLRGRATLQEADRIRAGFGGPPGSLDVGTELGFGVDAEQSRQERVAAQRQQLWGGLLAGIGLIWLVVGLVVAL